MPTRLTALLLALVLLWSGLSTIEAHGSLALPPSGQLSMAAPAAGQVGGSVEDHHLDDLPSQAQGDPPAETPGLPGPRLRAPSPQAERDAPRGALSAATVSPCLAGPLRPPCSAARTA